MLCFSASHSIQDLKRLKTETFKFLEDPKCLE